jgi:hypothetical protein
MVLIYIEINHVSAVQDSSLPYLEFFEDVMEIASGNRLLFHSI